MRTARTPANQYPIRAVARLTGLSVDTLRAWERRYEAVVPSRSRRGRLYSDADVARLKRLADLVQQGHAIGSIAASSDAELARLLAGADALAVAAPAPGATVKLEPLLRALDRYDLEEIERILNRYAVVLPPRDIVFALVVPLLREIGERWQAGKLRPSQEHLVSAVVRSVLGGLLRASGRVNASPTIVFATPSGERHELGLLCAALLAASAGYAVVYLGPDVPASDVVHAAATTGARIVVLSATAAGASAKSDARKLSSLPADVELWVGGPDADAVIAAAGRARRIENLDALIPMLGRHAH